MFLSSSNITFDFFSFPNKPKQAVDECRVFLHHDLGFMGSPFAGICAGGAVDENTTSPGSQRPWLFGQAAPFFQPMVTDRPSFSVGPGMVPRGRIQFETGYTFSFEDAHPNVKTHTFPETLVRIGLTDRVEFRLEWPTLTIIENGTDVH
jgi:hypothetical protein